MNRRELLLAAAAAPVALALPASARAAARGGTPLALVTADSDDRVLVVRLSDMRVVRSLAVPAPAARDRGRRPAAAPRSC